MTIENWAFLTLGIAIGLATALTVYLIDGWAARKHDQVLAEALPAPDEKARERVAAGIADIEHYLADRPFNVEEEGGL